MGGHGWGGAGRSTGCRMSSASSEVARLRSMVRTAVFSARVMAAIPTFCKHRHQRVPANDSRQRVQVDVAKDALNTGRFAKPAGYILAALQALTPLLGGVAITGRRRHLGLAIRDLALDCGGKLLVFLYGASVHVAELGPEPLIGFGIAELQGALLIERHHRDAGVDVDATRPSARRQHRLRKP